MEKSRMKIIKGGWWRATRISIIISFKQQGSVCGYNNEKDGVVVKECRTGEKHDPLNYFFYTLGTCIFIFVNMFAFTESIHI